MKPAFLRPFWRYFGAKWRIAPKYPAPKFQTLVEPFAGAAGYSLRHYERDVVLVEENPVVASVWRYLIGATGNEIRRIPYVEAVDDLPAWVPQEARWFVGFTLCAGDTRPRARMSPMVKRDGGCWKIDRLAAQVDLIKHWRIIEGSYLLAPDARATWFVDAPYFVSGAPAKGAKDKGRVRYPNGAEALDFPALGRWCRAREGQVIVCEQEGAEWLPFQPLGHFSSAKPGGVSREVVWFGERGAGNVPA